MLFRFSFYQAMHSQRDASLSAHRFSVGKIAGRSLRLGNLELPILYPSFLVRGTVPALETNSVGVVVARRQRPAEGFNEFAGSVRLAFGNHFVADNPKAKNGVFRCQRFVAGKHAKPTVDAFHDKLELGSVPSHPIKTGLLILVGVRLRGFHFDRDGKVSLGNLRHLAEEDVSYIGSRIRGGNHLDFQSFLGNSPLFGNFFEPSPFGLEFSDPFGKGVFKNLRFLGRDESREQQERKSK